MLQPKGYKYRKMHRVGKPKISLRNIKISFGVYGLKAVEGGILHSREIESGRMVIKRGIKKRGALWLRKFPDISITSKKSGVRMGKGKGNVTGWVCLVNSGEMLYEVSGIPKKLALEVLKTVSSKLSVKNKIVIIRE